MNLSPHKLYIFSMEDKWYSPLLKYDIEKYFQTRISEKTFKRILKLIKNYLKLLNNTKA